MAIAGMEISLRLFDTYSLKDKRSVVKSITRKMQNKFNISIAEIAQQDMLNEAVIGISVVSNTYQAANRMLDTVLYEIEDQFEIEIFKVELFEL